MRDAMRIMDASANRAREAMRVMEDAARFLLDDAELAGELKAMRHALREALTQLPGAGLSGGRDTPGDVGVAIEGAGEYQRRDVRDVVIAAGKRLSEALRSLEEYSKTLAPAQAADDGSAASADSPPSDPPDSPDPRRKSADDAEPSSAAWGVLKHNAPRQFEALRYRGYEVERRLHLAMPGDRAAAWRVCVLVSEALCPQGDWRRIVNAVCQTADAVQQRTTNFRGRGAICVQLREKHLDDRELLQRAKWTVETCHAAGVDVILNDRPDLARLAGADGVHLGQTDLPATQVRRLLGSSMLIGVSTSQLAEAQQALRDGADYCGVGPMFPTTTKHKPLLAGPAYLREFAQWGRLPGLAIGGVNPDNARELKAAGATGVAVSACVCSADNPATVVQRLYELMEEKKPAKPPAQS